MNRTCGLLFFLCTAAPTVTVACDEKPSTPPFGDLAITTSAPTVEAGFRTSDGWQVSYQRFLVNVSAVHVSGSDNVLAASADAQVIDQAAPGSKALVTGKNRVARAWQDVNFEIGPAKGESTPIAPVTDADRDNMVKNKFSIYVEGTMIRGAERKSLKWGFSSDTLYKACSGVLADGASAPGLIVPQNGIDAAEVTMAGDVLFYDTFGARGRALRGNPIAEADKDQDGTVTLSELETTSLEDARVSTGAYGTNDETIDNLASFLGEQARSAIVTFRAQGKCTAEPAGADVPAAAGP